MKIRFLVSIAGYDGHSTFSYAPGDVVDWPDEQALKWADGVRAELVDPGWEKQAGPEWAPHETAVTGPPEITTEETQENTEAPAPERAVPEAAASRRKRGRKRGLTNSD